jgi:hypothetical protein
MVMGTTTSLLGKLRYRIHGTYGAYSMEKINGLKKQLVVNE